MKLLIIGGAGYVGSIVREALESRHDCTHLDLQPIAETRGRMIVGNVHDDATVTEAVAGQDAVLYLAMGVEPGGQRKNVNELDSAFGVNVRDVYRVLNLGLDAGVRRFVYASSLSVYRASYQRRIDETVPADTWSPAYGLTKRLGEAVCAAAAQHEPEASVLALRLIRPTNDADWPVVRTSDKAWCALALGPDDTRRLFCAAVAFHQPGYHMVQASSDTSGATVPTTRAEALLGWAPQRA